ncbi:DUF3223 family protein [Medicago truncatula]|uniref:DUF3223 family protein n=1 Tax=Medicago truncatula TaxID=3880 RepID=A0A072TSP8_MEDTR|nr:DUF3223 family protein [Medicago truncatula]
MTETAAPEPQIVESNATVAVDMVIENAELAEVTAIDSEANDESNQKRARDDDEKRVTKKQKVEAEVEEDEEGEEEKKPSGPLFDYFNSFLHAWGPNLNVNKYEHTMLLELLMKGHPEPDQKIGGKIRAFQVRKEDESADDFSFRKCVDHILPLPEAMQVKHDANRALGGSGKGKHRGGGGRGGARGHGGKGKPRH